MKKLTVIHLTAVLSLCLASCEVHAFNQTFEAPWWLIAIPYALFVIAVTYFAGRHIASIKYVCPHCGKRFYPKPWAAAFSMHVNDLRVFRCPHCKEKNLCNPSYDQTREL